MIGLIAAVFVASLTGSLHCAGMCGPFVAFGVGAPVDRWGRRLRLQLAYNGGRLASYTMLGGLAGGLGAALDLGGTVLGFQRAALIVAGLAMIGVGVITLLRALGVSIIMPGSPQWLRSSFRRCYGAVRELPAGTRALSIGLLSTLLPCGWMYAFAITAAGTGSPARGALTMAVFWLGTLPVLVSLGVGVQKLAGPLRRYVPLATALALVAVGLIAVIGRLNVPALAADQTVIREAASIEASIERIESLDPKRMPCCAEKE
ncbi:MAG: sulfite exporter TauE/SafE family protein [Acidobacteriota bacterium]|nr:MAG: sulfite exporter TauE/SafE family protein [Acidobacteriota bacterium]